MKERKKITRKRIYTDDKFERTRENMEEFGRAGEADKLIRRAFRELLPNIADRYVSGRLTKITSMIISADEANRRGERMVLKENLHLLEGFNFNRYTKLADTFLDQSDYAFNRQTGKVTARFQAFIPTPKLKSKANYFRLYVCAAFIDFKEKEVTRVYQATDEYASTTTPTGPVDITFSLPAGSLLPVILSIGIEFYRLKRGARPSLVEKEFNAMAVGGKGACGVR